MVKSLANANHYEEITIGVGKNKTRKGKRSLDCYANDAFNEWNSKLLSLEIEFENSKFYLRHKITIHMKLSAQPVHRAYVCLLLSYILGIWWNENKLEMKSIICTKWFCFNLSHPFAIFIAYRVVRAMCPWLFQIGLCLNISNSMWWHGCSWCCIATTNVIYKFRNRPIIILQGKCLHVLVEITVCKNFYQKFQYHFRHFVRPSIPKLPFLFK